jgi:hypothetical protein
MDPAPSPTPPRIAVLIGGHANPLVFGRLTGALRHEGIGLFAHLDARVDLAPFRAAAGAPVHFLEDRLVNLWGAWSQVEVMLRLLRAAHAAGPFDSYAFVSADALPRLMPDALVAALAATPTMVQFARFEKDHVFHKRVAGIYLPQTGFGRVRELGHWMDNIRIDPSEFDDILAAMRTAKAKANLPFAVFKGNQWMAISRRHLEALFDFLARDRDFTEIYRYSLIPDESFFHSALKQVAPGLRSRGGLMGLRWPPSGSASPLTLRTMDHLPVVRAARCLFFRKFADDALALADAVLAARLGPAEAAAEGWLPATVPA